MLTKDYKAIGLFLEFCNNKNDSEIVLTCINSLLRSLINLEFNEFMSMNRLNKKIFGVCIKFLLFTNFHAEDMIEIWTKSFSCIEMALGSPLSLENIVERLDFWPVIKALRRENYDFIREKIIFNTFEILISFLLEKNTNIVKVPDVIPLICEFLCSYNSVFVKYEAVIQNIFKNPINLKLFAKYNFLKIFSYHLDKTKDFSL